MTELQNSTFKEKASKVKDVSKILPEVGAVVLNENDGRLYAADKFGWHRFGDPYSPVVLFIDFNGTDQFVFTFRAPATSSIEIHDGDGTVTDVSGNDDVDVDHTTNYSKAGLYYFSVVGDVLDLTVLDISNTSGQAFVRGDISGWSALENLTVVRLGNTPVSGNVELFNDSLNMIEFLCLGTEIDGEIESLSNLVNLVSCNFGNNRNIQGDVSKLNALESCSFINMNTNLSFRHVVSWSVGGLFFFQDCGWSHLDVDNCLISLANGSTSGQTINIAGNNAKRTHRSDAAFTYLDANNTLTVNS